MQMFHRGVRGSDRSGNYSNDNNFNHGSGTTDGVEVRYINNIIFYKYQ